MGWLFQRKHPLHFDQIKNEKGAGRKRKRKFFEIWNCDFITNCSVVYLAFLVCSGESWNGLLTFRFESTPDPSLWRRWREWRRHKWTRMSAKRTQQWPMGTKVTTSSPSRQLRRCRRHPNIYSFHWHRSISWNFFKQWNAFTPGATRRFQAARASVERLFSCAGLIMTPLRTRVTDANFEAKVLLNFNKLL